jgi:hypothetical protein
MTKVGQTQFLNILLFIEFYIGLILFTFIYVRCLKTFT